MSQIAKIFNGNIDQAIEKWPKHLYVKNCCEDKMTLIITVKDATGTSVTIKLPKTWFPIDIFNYIDKESASRSSQLRGLLRSGNLKIVEADSAEEILKMPQAREEAKRLGLVDYGFVEDSHVSEEKPFVIPQREEKEVERDFYSIRKMAIEDAEDATDAYNIAAEVYSSYIAEADEELLKNEKVTSKIKDMKKIAENKIVEKKDEGYKKAVDKFDELLAFIAENNK